MSLALRKGALSINLQPPFADRPGTGGLLWAPRTSTLQCARRRANPWGAANGGGWLEELDVDFLSRTKPPTPKTQQHLVHFFFSGIWMNLEEHQTEVTAMFVTCSFACLFWLGKTHAMKSSDNQETFIQAEFPVLDGPFVASSLTIGLLSTLHH